MAAERTDHIELSMTELREVTRFATAPADTAVQWLAAEPDPRVTQALQAAGAFAAGAPRSRWQRTAAVDAHRAAREATDPIGRHVAAAAGDAAASAYLHPLAKGTQVAHILRSTVHAALAGEAAKGPQALDEALDDATGLATPLVLEVLRRYPPYPAGPGRLAQLVCQLDGALRQR